MSMAPRTLSVTVGIERGKAFPVLLHELGEHAGKLGFKDDADYKAILAA